MIEHGRYEKTARWRAKVTLYKSEDTIQAFH